MDDSMGAVDCVQSAWADSGSCSVTCGEGTMIQTRTIETEMANGGTPCGPETKTVTCATTDCPVVPDPVAIPESTPAPTKEVKFTFKLSLTDAEYETHKGKVKTDMSSQLGVAEAFLTITKVVQRRRALSPRRRLSGVTLDTTVQTDDESSVISIINNDNFDEDLGARITSSTGIEVTVSDVTEPTSSNLQVSDDDSSSTNLTWLYVLIAIFGVLAIAGGVYLFMTSQGDGDKTTSIGGAELSGEAEMTK